jgi:hypothetical protein
MYQQYLYILLKRIQEEELLQEGAEKLLQKVEEELPLKEVEEELLNKGI